MEDFHNKNRSDTDKLLVLIVVIPIVSSTCNFEAIHFATTLPSIYLVTSRRYCAYHVRRSL